MGQSLFVAHVMGFVNNDQVEEWVHFLNSFQDRLASDALNRSDRAERNLAFVGFEFVEEVEEGLGVKDLKLLSEAIFHLPLPFSAKGGGTDHEDSVEAGAGAEFGKNEAGFNGLAEADLIGN